MSRLNIFNQVCYSLSYVGFTFSKAVSNINPVLLQMTTVLGHYPMHFVSTNSNFNITGLSCWARFSPLWNASGCPGSSVCSCFSIFTLPNVALCLVLSCCLNGSLFFAVIEGLEKPPTGLRIEEDDLFKDRCAGREKSIDWTSSCFLNPLLELTTGPKLPNTADPSATCGGSMRNPTAESSCLALNFSLWLFTEECDTRRRFCAWHLKWLNMLLWSLMGTHMLRVFNRCFTWIDADNSAFASGAGIALLTLLPSPPCTLPPAALWLYM